MPERATKGDPRGRASTGGAFRATVSGLPLDEPITLSWCIGRIQRITPDHRDPRLTGVTTNRCVHRDRCITMDPIDATNHRVTCVRHLPMLHRIHLNARIALSPQHCSCQLATTWVSGDPGTPRPAPAPPGLAPLLSPSPSTPQTNHRTLARSSPPTTPHASLSLSRIAPVQRTQFHHLYRA